jgi:L-arabinose isomerase
MSSDHPLRAGLCGIGLDAYWSQFAGLEERLKGYVAQVRSRLTRPGVEVVNLGLIDTPQRSRETGHQCRREDIDVLEYRSPSCTTRRRAGDRSQSSA